MDGLAVDRAAVDHDRRHAGVDALLEGGQVQVLQLGLVDGGVGAVHAAVGRRVAGEVLGGGGHRSGARQVAALQAADRRRAERAGQQRVLAEGLVRAAPAQVALGVEDGGEVPYDARRAHRAPGALAQVLGERRVERRAQPDLVGDHGGVEEVVVAMDGVGAVDDRDAQAVVGSIERVLLNRVDLVGPRLAVVAHRRPRAAAGQDGADPVDVQHVVHEVGVERAAVPRRIRNALQDLDVDLPHLPDLLGEHHAREQVLHALVDGQRGVLVGRDRGVRARRGRCARAQPQEERDERDHPRHDQHPAAAPLDRRRDVAHDLSFW
jgi:hypothetical protein